MAVKSHSIGARITFPDGHTLKIGQTWVESQATVPITITVDGTSVVTDYNTLKYMMDALKNEAKVSGKNL